MSEPPLSGSASEAPFRLQTAAHPQLNSRASRLWLLILGLDLVALLTQLVLSKPVLLVDGQGPPPTITFDTGQIFRAEEVAQPGVVRLRVTNESKTIRRISFTPPTTERHGRLIATDLYRPVTGNFGLERESGRWSASQPGSAVDLTAEVTGLSIDFACGELEGVACVATQAGENKRCFDLGACNGWVTYEHPSTNRTWIWRIPFRAEEATLNVPFTNARVVLGNQVLATPQAENGRLSVAAPAVRTLLGELLRFLFQTVALFALYFLIGFALCAAVLPAIRLSDALLLCALAGVAWTASFATAANHLTPLGNALIPALVLACVPALVWRRRVVEWAQQIDRGEARLALAAGAIALMSAAVFFFPAALEAGWYSGHVYTDSVYFMALAKISELSPLNPDPGVIRYADFDSLGVSGLLLGLAPRAAYGPHHAFFWLLVPLSVYVIARRQFAKGALTLAAIAAHASIIFTVGSQCYMSQYMVIVLTIGALAACAWWFAVDERWRLPGGVLLAIVFSAVVAVYPHQAVVPLGFAIACAIAAWKLRSLRPVKALVVVGALSLLFVNWNLDVVLRMAEHKSNFETSINEIGRHTVFPFYRDAKVFGPILLGLRDFVRASGTIHQVCPALLNGAGCSGVVTFSQWIADYSWIPAVALLAVLFFGLWFARRSPVGQATLAVLVVFGAVTARMLATDQPYYFGKLALALAGVAMLPLVWGLAALLAARHWALRAVAVAATLIFVALNLNSLIMDNMVHFIPRASSLAGKIRSHVAAQQPELRALERFAETKLRRTDVVLVTGEAIDVRMTDTDRVTYNFAIGILSRAKVIWGKHGEVQWFQGYDLGAIDPPPNGVDYVVEWRGRVRTTPPPGYTEVETNKLFSIFERKAHASR